VTTRAANAAVLAALLGAVAIAFADSAIVVLALPDLLKQYDVSINSMAWVVTGYNLALALGALALVRVASRVDAARLARLGGLAFVASSLLCAVAPSVWLLVALRCAQGLAGAGLLVGALPLTRATAATPGGGTALWAAAGVFGAALGPALGGVLTEVFSWRAIFFAQAPVAALGLAAALRPLAPEPPDETEQAVDPQAPRRGAANLALGLASAALVGLLFLAVVQLVDVWRLSPLRAGVVVSVIPVAALFVQPAAARAGAAAIGAGAVLFAGGLAGMAFLPARDVIWVVVALSISGLGFGLVIPALTRSALSGGAPPAASGALTVSIRHLGLVLGLLVLTPLLTADLTAAGDRAQLRGISVVLDAPVQATTKLRLAVDLAPVLASPARKELPTFAAVLAPEHDPDLTAIGRQLDTVVQASVTRGFRRSFVVAGLFALLAAGPLLLRRRGRAADRRTLRAPAAALATGVALVGVELGSGALAYGARPKLLPPCAERQASVTGAQGAALTALDFVACRFHKGREQLVADVARSGVNGAEFAARIERYAERASDLPGWLRDLVASAISR
jgi:MFS family permease